MALPCCLPLIDDQTDSVDARANWAKVCGGALRRRRANSARALCAHTGLASAIALRGEVIWHLAVVVSRMKASPCRPHFQQNCTILCPPLGALSSRSGGPPRLHFWTPFWHPDARLRLPFWGSFWVPKMTPILGTGNGRL